MKKSHINKHIAAVLLVSLFILGFGVTNSSATALTVDGAWDTADEYLTAPAFFSETWTFTAASAVNLFVTDFAVASDLFDVYANGFFLGSTSYAPESSNYTLDPDVAFASPAWSSGLWTLAAGVYEISILSTFVPSGYSDSTVAVKVATAPVPEPSTLLLLGSGLLGLGWYGRKRKKA